MIGTTYAFRSSALDKGETTFQLSDAALEIVRPESSSVIAFSEIKKVRLYHDPTRFAMNKYQCDLTLQNGATIVLKSVHYRGIADFEDRGTAYSAFIRELHERLKNFPGITFHSGNQPGCFAGNMVILIGTIILVAAALFYMGAPTTLGGIFKLMVVGVLAMFSVRYMKKNKPAHYSPDQIPDRVLPK